ncbi:MAG: histidine phosphatase family protein [Defluviimonas sp.]|uniref:histidine phosphatase family protein n=1 Tax=Albidovulum sp. TaxID=1872424 RepID=UPI001DECC738|nr:histidine phosphatase family protein [Paracoccaceae bacterium]MCC0064478.1 histidine phosphatase family protein [Defluviimonas sp.]
MRTAPISCPPLWLMRHSETEWNRAGRMQGRQDSPLTEKGRAQADALAPRLLALGFGPEVRLFSSPQGRARDTARRAFADLGRPVSEDARLSEISVGACEGLTRGEIEARWPGLIEPARPFDWYPRAPGGEGEAAFRLRVASFLGDLRGPAAIVAHGMTIRMIRSLILGLDWDGLMRLPGGQGNIFLARDGVVQDLG